MKPPIGLVLGVCSIVILLGTADTSLRRILQRRQRLGLSEQQTDGGDGGYGPNGRYK